MDQAKRFRGRKLRWNWFLGFLPTTRIEETQPKNMGWWEGNDGGRDLAVEREMEREERERRFIFYPSSILGATPIHWICMLSCWANL